MKTVIFLVLLVLVFCFHVHTQETTNEGNEDKVTEAEIIQELLVSEEYSDEKVDCDSEYAEAEAIDREHAEASAAVASAATLTSSRGRAAEGGAALGTPGSSTKPSSTSKLRPVDDRRSNSSPRRSPRISTTRDSMQAESSAPPPSLARFTDNSAEGRDTSRLRVQASGGKGAKAMSGIKKMSMNANIEDLESKLDPILVHQMHSQELIQLKATEEVSAMRARFSISRSYARPVEQLLRICLDDSSTHTRFYRMLRVSPGVSLSEVKKAYRKISLSIHPDKNPHPDAKEAFDCLQDAYREVGATLMAGGGAAASLAAEYAEQTASRPTRSFALTVVREYRGVVRRLQLYSSSAISRLQLTWHRLRSHQFAEEVNDIVGEPLANLRRNLRMLIYKFRFAPTSLDRMHLMMELVLDHSRLVGSSACIAAGMCFALQNKK